MHELASAAAAVSGPQQITTTARVMGARPDMRVTIYAGSASGTSATFVPQAAEFARELARAGVEIVYGGGSVGLMGAIADAALDEGGRVIGVIPQSLLKPEVAHRSLTELQVLPSMHLRKDRMADLGDCFVALPGGLGTVEEVFEVWAWLILGHHAKPVMLLNLNGYWDPMLAMVDHMAVMGFIKPAERESLVSIASASELFAVLATWRPPPARWG